ncbi:MAG: hypothetical protein PHG06_19735 [Parabacteroides sp.]|nr:hypothetical protein [Parabacteroides sp.]
MIVENKKRIRREFQPLTTAVSLKILTPASPVSQVYDPVHEYNPDREITPLAIFPEVLADAEDGSWTTHRANKLLANMKWYVNNVDIATLPAWAGLFTIETLNDNRGAITISRNIPVEEKVELHFEAVIPDIRIGINVPVKTNTILLSTLDRADDTYQLSIGDDAIIKYNPFYDKLLMYDYKLANGMSAGTRDEALDGNAYERTVNLLVTKGAKQVTNGYAVELYRLTGQNKTLLSASDLDVISISNTKIVFDLRTVEKADYLILIKEGTKEVARQQCSVIRIYPPFTIEPLSSVSINPGETLHRNIASVHQNGEIIRIPEPIIRMLWFTDTANITGKEWQEGSRTVVELNRTGIGETYLDDWMDIYVAAEQKGAFYGLTDGINDYTDSIGNDYINY